MSPRIPAVLAVALLAVLSCVSFPVTDSWFSDTESVDVSVELDRTQEELESFSIANGDSIQIQRDEEGSYLLVPGIYSMVVTSAVSLDFIQNTGSCSIIDESGATVRDLVNGHNAFETGSYYIKVYDGSVSLKEALSQT